jgi:hypothetical protein
MAHPFGHPVPRYKDPQPDSLLQLSKVNQVQYYLNVIVLPPQHGQPMVFVTFAPTW